MTKIPFWLFLPLWITWIIIKPILGIIGCAIGLILLVPIIGVIDLYSLAKESYNKAV